MNVFDEMFVNVEFEGVLGFRIFIVRSFMGGDFEVFGR